MTGTKVPNGYGKIREDSMAIHFSKDRMEEVKDNYRRWWNGELDRPIVNLTLHGAHPHPSNPARPGSVSRAAGISGGPPRN